MRATTIIAVLIWEGKKSFLKFMKLLSGSFFIVWRNQTGNAPIIDFTAEMRIQPDLDSNDTENDVSWERLDPHHITPNARYLEVYHLKVCLP